MITIHFSQCGEIPPSDKLIIYPLVMLSPANLRGPHYEQSLLNATKEHRHVDFRTYDELCLLAAQYLHRKHRIKARFVSYCTCDGFLKSQVVRLDDGGDMLEELHHGYFSQRLKYLR